MILIELIRDFASRSSRDFTHYDYSEERAYECREQFICVPKAAKRSYSIFPEENHYCADRQPGEGAILVGVFPEKRTDDQVADRRASCRERV